MNKDIKKKGDHCSVCKDWEKPKRRTKPLGDKRGWEMILFEEFEDGDWSYTSVHDLVEKLVARTKKDMVEEIEKKFVPNRFPFNSNQSNLECRILLAKDWKTIKKQLLKI